MLFGRLKLPDEDKDDGGVEVMIMLGRFHLYEGYTIDQASPNRKGFAIKTPMNVYVHLPPLPFPTACSVLCPCA